MPSEEGREVLRLLGEKKIDSEQAYRLLVALGDIPRREEPRPRRNAWSWGEERSTSGFAGQFAEEFGRKFGKEFSHKFGREFSGKFQEGVSEHLRGRVLRIRITEGGRPKVNVAIPVSLARLGRIRGVSRMLERSFGINLDELIREIRTYGKIVDVVDEDGDRVEISVE